MLYARGARAFLDGGNPWDATIVGGGHLFHFAGLPLTVLAFIPFARMPEVSVAWGSVIVSGLAAVLIVRRLGLTWWYLAFPPLVAGTLSGNPQVLLVALLITGLGPVAAMLKVYAVVPLAGERRWWALALTIALFVGSAVAAPNLWAAYLGNLGPITSRLAAEASGGYSAWGRPFPVLVATVVALAVIARYDRRAASWLAIPALWPASEYHYATMVLPIATPVIALAMAIPWYGVPAVVTIGYAALLVVETHTKQRWSFRRLTLVESA